MVKSGHPLYQCWRDMLNRCYRSAAQSYKFYGLRGIEVCKRWRDEFDNFVADMGPHPDGFQIDRIDSNGHYSPENCRWVDLKTQHNNKRSNRLLTYEGRTQTLQQWADELGMDKTTLRSRLEKQKMSIARALTQPVGQQLRRYGLEHHSAKPFVLDGVEVPRKEALARAGVSESTFYARKQRGWSLEQALGREHPPSGPTQRNRKGLESPAAKPITYNGVTRTRAEWATHLGLTYGGFHARMKKNLPPGQLFKPRRH